MSGRGRRLTVLFLGAALVLTLGRWASSFLAERLWEASVSEALAQAGSRRALYELGLELLGVAVAAAWFTIHLHLAARIALPDRAPPGSDQVRLWPERIPRWWLTGATVLLGITAGTGTGRWLDEIQLMAADIRFGLPDPLLGVDLGFFLRDFPFLLHLQGRLFLLSAAALGLCTVLYLAGGVIRRMGRRLWVAPQARGHLAFLLATTAVALAAGSALEPFRLAAGARGAMLHSEFLLRTLMAEVEAGLGLAAAAASVLWWLRVRGMAVAITWVLLGVAVMTGRILPLRTEIAAGDPDWQVAMQRLDSVAYRLGGLEGPPLVLATPAAAMLPSLWDDQILERTGADSGAIRLLGPGWIAAGGRARPVRFGLHPFAGGTSLVALSDDEASGSGGLLSWREGAAEPAPGPWIWRELPAHGVRPGALSVEADSTVRGVSLDSWARRLILAWALQTRAAFTAPSGSRLGWRLDPATRLSATAPFAHWTAPRPRPAPGGGVMWTSDGLLTSPAFPSSVRIQWTLGPVAMVRPTFTGVVDAATGGVRIFLRDDRDPLGTAWARIMAPLIEPASRLPTELATGEPYPEELLLSQVRALEGPAWHAGRVERPAADAPALPPMGPGGSDGVVPFQDPVSRRVTGFLTVRRTPAGDSLRLVRIDSTRTVESEASLAGKWTRFPFHEAIRDSVRAAGADLKQGRIRHALVSDGIVAYQPVFATGASGETRLVLVHVALGSRLGTGRSFEAAWRNLRGETSPLAPGAGAQAILDAAREWMRHADSALKRGDLQELGRALAYLRDLLDPHRRP